MADFDLDRIIVEVDRVIKDAHIYDELYCDSEAIKVLHRVSPLVFQSVQRALHNELIMATSRLLYDGNSYSYKNTELEYLSLFNIVTKYSDYLDDEINAKRDELRSLKETLNIKSYRDLILAHADKLVYSREIDVPSHKTEIECLLRLLKLSRYILFRIRLKFARKHNETSIPIFGCDVMLDGEGRNFIRKLSKI